MYVGEGVKVLVPKLSENTHSGIRQVPSRAARAGKGLRKQLQGMLRPITAIQKRIDLGWDTSPTGEKGRYSSRKRDRRRSPVSSEKREKVQKWTYHH